MKKINQNDIDNIKMNDKMKSNDTERIKKGGKMENRTFTPKEIRRLLGMSQKQMAEMLGISVPTLSRREAGTSKWSVLEIEKIAQLSDIPLEKITA